MAPKTIILLLMVIQGICGDPFMKMFHPTGFNCLSAWPGGVLVDSDLELTAGKRFTVAAQYDVTDYVDLKYYICPSEIPEDFTEPWQFNCFNRQSVSIAKDTHDALLDLKFMFYYNLSMTRIKIPSNVTCTRCGLQVEAAVKECMGCEPHTVMTSCAFIRVTKRGNILIPILPPSRPDQPLPRPNRPSLPPTRHTFRPSALPTVPLAPPVLPPCVPHQLAAPRSLPNSVPFTPLQAPT
ncbi:uncharacterized protein LOC123509299 [Portunus trituberculatus]|uniref:uncharacterized protein LOC123509299 n=1 Tax=Portunus trituberculatus TaxID=210409 RepID=UPI001E1CD26A|nr:uncharacterized protein LOC123509299 [Portunus trituberculatus]